MWIYGTAGEAHRGKVIELRMATDYITGFQAVEDVDTVRADGTFSLTLHSEITQPVTLNCGKTFARLYVQPDFQYSVIYPGVDTLRLNERELQLNLAVIGNDSTELNALIFDFQELYNSIVAGNDDRYLSRQLLFRRADSLKVAADKRYQHIADPFFKAYVDYQIASLNLSVSRGTNFMVGNYIAGKPVLSRHSEYMQFFATCFKGYFNSIASRFKGRSLYNIVNKQANLEELHAYLKQDPLMRNDSLRELVMIANLWEAYYLPEFKRASVVKLITALNHTTQHAGYRRITSNMLSHFSKMLPGSMAPAFEAFKPDGSTGTPGDFKGRWLYLNFFSTGSIESLREMPKIAALHKKYGDKVVFLSVCTDADTAACRKYMRNNPSYRWPIWFNTGDPGSKATDRYGVVGDDAYFLISNTGYLNQSPALRPSEGIELKFDQIFRVKKKKTKTGIR